MEPINLSILDAARTLGIGRSKLYELISNGDLETVKLGTRTLVRVASIKVFSDSLSKQKA
jgi:excisionase family DNA binding protein